MKPLEIHDEVLIPLSYRLDNTCHNVDHCLIGHVQHLIEGNRVVVFITSDDTCGYRRVDIFDINRVIKTEKKKKTMSKENITLNQLAYLMIEYKKDDSASFKNSVLANLQPKKCKIKDIDHTQIPADLAKSLKGLAVPKTLKNKLKNAASVDNATETVKSKETPKNDVKQPTKVVKAEEDLRKAEKALERQAKFEPPRELKPWEKTPMNFIEPHGDVWGKDKSKEFVTLSLQRPPKVDAIILLKLSVDTGTKYIPMVVGDISKTTIKMNGYINNDISYIFPETPPKDNMAWAPLDLVKFHDTKEYKKYSKKNNIPKPDKNIPMKDPKTGAVDEVPRNLVASFIEKGYEKVKKWALKQYKATLPSPEPKKKAEKKAYTFRELISVIGISRRTPAPTLTVTDKEGNKTVYYIKKRTNKRNFEITHSAAQAILKKDKTAKLTGWEFPNLSEDGSAKKHHVDKKITKKPNISKEKAIRKARPYIPTGLSRAKLFMMKMINQKATADATDEEGKFDENKFRELVAKEKAVVDKTTKDHKAEAKIKEEAAKVAQSKKDKEAANKRKADKAEKEAEKRKNYNKKKEDSAEAKRKAEIQQKKNAAKLEKPYSEPVEVPMKSKEEQQKAAKGNSHLKVVKK